MAASASRARRRGGSRAERRPGRPVTDSIMSTRTTTCRAMIRPRHADDHARRDRRRCSSTRPDADQHRDHRRRLFIGDGIDAPLARRRLDLARITHSTGNVPTERHRGHRARRTTTTKPYPARSATICATARLRRVGVPNAGDATDQDFLITCFARTAVILERDRAGRACRQMPIAIGQGLCHRRSTSQRPTGANARRPRRRRSNHHGVGAHDHADRCPG